MVDHFKLITITHKYLDTNELSQFMLKHEGEDELVDRLIELKEHFEQEEILYLATCNRVMIILYGVQEFISSQAIDLFLRVNPSLDVSQHQNLGKVVNFYKGIAAINHLMEVTASIDSLVVGEREIFRQFREAYKFSSDNQLSHDNMRILERCTVRAAKDVFTRTDIGAKPVSVASLTIQEFLKRKVPKDDHVLLVGAGETNTKVGRFLKKYGYSNLVIFNRSLDNAQSLSQELDAQAFYLSELENYSQPFSAIVTCTAAQDPIITPALWQKLNPQLESKVVVDLSIPNNVSPEVKASESTDYISISSIQVLADENLKFRNSNITAARILLKPHVQEFINMAERRKVERAFSQLPQQIQAVKDRALHKVYKNQIDAMPEEAQELINEICSYMEKKCVAVPMKLAKSVV